MPIIRFLKRVLVNYYVLNKKTRSWSNLSSNKFNNTAHIFEDNINMLQSASEDLSEVSPHLPKTFNLAAYVNNSEILKNLLYLNVNLNKIEKKPHIAEKIMKLKLNEIKDHILFIKDYIGTDNIGNFISRNPMILCESIDDLKIRVNYLLSKQFSDEQIEHIILKNPFWLMFSTTRIDRRLGFYQHKFKLYGDEVRIVASKQPKLITYNLHHVTTNTFIIKEEMGFQDSEIKQLILCKPKLWMINQKALLERFNYIHNVIKVPHSIILKYPGTLLCRNFKIKQRHLFLEKLGRSQYNPNKENYVPLIALAVDTDTEFCLKYAKCNVSDYNVFLKTL